MEEVYIYGAYASEHDMTFIVKDVFEDGEIKSTEVIGFYYGEPNEENTKEYSNGKLKATY